MNNNLTKQTQKNIRKSLLYKHHNTSLIKLITLFAMAPPSESQYWHSAGQNNFLVTKVTRGTHEVAINSQAVNQRPVATLSWFFLFERGLCGPLTSHFWLSCYALALTS